MRIGFAGQAALGPDRPYAQAVDALPAPMLPRGDLPPPVGKPGWIWEYKFDGIRVIAASARGRWRLVTRKGNDIANQFPELAHDLLGIGDVVVDGELIVLTPRSRIDFRAVQRRLRVARPAEAAERTPATVVAFDLLRADGDDLCSRPYTERRAALEARVPTTAYWSVPPVGDDGPSMIAASRKHGLEGVVAKLGRSRYESGRRSASWIKYRHREVIDVVVIGWRRRDSGGLSLLLGEQDPAGLTYVGSCTAPRDLIADLEPLAAAAAPCPVPAAASRDVHWVAPLLALEVWAASREPDGHLRQPRYLRPRLDQLE